MLQCHNPAVSINHCIQNYTSMKLKISAVRSQKCFVSSALQNQTNDSLFHKGFLPVDLVDFLSFMHREREDGREGVGRGREIVCVRARVCCMCRRVCVCACACVCVCEYECVGGWVRGEEGDVVCVRNKSSVILIIRCFISACIHSEIRSTYRRSISSAVSSSQRKS